MISVLTMIKGIQEETSDDETHTLDIKIKDDGTRNTELIEPLGIKLPE